MTYQLEFIQHPSYIHVVVTGENTKDNIERYLQALVHELGIRECRRVLVEERLDGPRLGMFPVFEIVRDGSQEARGKFDAIAFVDVNAEGDFMKFAETVAVNRGIPMAVFPTVAEAEEWIRVQPDNGVNNGHEP